MPADRSDLWNTLQSQYEDPDTSMPGGRGAERLTRQVSEPEYDTLIDLARDVFFDLWRWKSVIMLMMVLGGGTALAYLKTTEEMYRAKTSVLFDFSRQAVVSGLPADAIAPTDAILNSEMEVLTSRTFMGSVVDELDLITDPEFNPWQPDETGKIGTTEERPPPGQVRSIVGENLADQVSIKLVPDSYVFDIRAESSSPEKAARLANTMARLFIEQRETRGQATMDEATAWIDRRVNELRRMTLEAEQHLNEQRLQAPSNGDALLEALVVQIQASKDRRSDLEDQIAEIERTSTTIAQMVEAGNPDAALEVLRSWSPRFQQPAGLIILLQELRRGDAGDTSERVLSDVIASLDEIVAGYAAQAELLDANIAELEEDYSAVSTEWLTLKDLERTALAHQTSYASILEQQRAGTVGQAIIPSMPDANVISEAIPPLKAAYPEKKLVLVLGALSGMVFGVAITAGLSYSDPVVRSARDVTRSQAAFVVGSIRLPRKRIDPQLFRKASRTTSRIYRNLRRIRNELLANSVSRSKTFHFAAMNAAPSCETLAYLISQMGLREGERALIVAVNLPNTPLFKKSEPISIQEFSDWDVSFPPDSIMHHDEFGLDVLNLHCETKHDAEVLRNFLKKIREPNSLDTYDVINIVTKPLEESSISYFVARETDKLVLVVEQGLSRRDELISVTNNFKRNGVRQFPAVLVRSRG